MGSFKNAIIYKSIDINQAITNFSLTDRGKRNFLVVNLSDKNSKAVDTINPKIPITPQTSMENLYNTFDIDG